MRRYRGEEVAGRADEDAARGDAGREPTHWNLIGTDQQCRRERTEGRRRAFVEPVDHARNVQAIGGVGRQCVGLALVHVGSPGQRVAVQIALLDHVRLDDPNPAGDTGADKECEQRSVRDRSAGNDIDVTYVDLFR